MCELGSCEITQKDLHQWCCRVQTLTFTNCKCESSQGFSKLQKKQCQYLLSSVFVPMNWAKTRAFFTYCFYLSELPLENAIDFKMSSTRARILAHQVLTVWAQSILFVKCGVSIRYQSVFNRSEQIPCPYLWQNYFFYDYFYLPLDSGCRSWTKLSPISI